MFRAIFRITAFSLSLILLTGLLYPLTVTGISQILFHHRATGSLVEARGQVIGSTLIAQPFTSPRYFHPRPSAADYAADGSGASNLGVTSGSLNTIIQERVGRQRNLNGEGTVPADLVTASGSGLDPHITPQTALYQVRRVAEVRGLPLEEVQALIDRMTEGRTLGFLGMPRVNVLAINLELDRMSDE